MVNPRQVVRALVFALLLSLLSAASVSMAYGQFTLTVSKALSPSAIDPGGSSLATLNVAAVGSFDSPVSFDTVPCTVTPVQQPARSAVCGKPQLCNPTRPSLPDHFNHRHTQPGLYTVSVTGTSGSARKRSL
jgi:hypothetical protein